MLVEAKKIIPGTTLISTTNTKKFDPKGLQYPEGKTAFQVVEAVQKKYNVPEHDGLASLYSFDIIVKSLGFDTSNLSSLKGKYMLDLGCGAVDAENLPFLDKTRDFEPWIARCFYEAGAYVVGIDIMAQKNEPFAAQQLNLMTKGALDFISSESFDLVICRHLLTLSGRINSDDNSPKLSDMAFGISLTYMRNELLSQVRRILVKDGKLYGSIDNASYGLFIKKDNGLFFQLDST